MQNNGCEYYSCGEPVTYEVRYINPKFLHKYEAGMDAHEMRTCTYHYNVLTQYESRGELKFLMVKSLESTGMN